MKKIFLFLCLILIPFPGLAASIVPTYNSYNGIGSSPYNPIYLNIEPTEETENKNTVVRLKNQYGLTNYYDCISTYYKSYGDLGNPNNMSSLLRLVESCLERKQIRKETQCPVGSIFSNGACTTIQPTNTCPDRRTDPTVTNFIYYQGNCFSSEVACKIKYGDNSEYGFGPNSKNIGTTFDAQGFLIQCNCQSGYEWENDTCVKKEIICAVGTINVGNSCLTYTQHCNNYYGSNTNGILGSNGVVNCSCNDGFAWNANNTECVTRINNNNLESNVLTNSDNKIYDSALAKRLSGKILLQVESHGEAWYVDPVTLKRYYMKDGNAAYEMLRKFGLGVTDNDLQKIPTEDSTDKGNIVFINKMKGKILLQVQQHGEAWYVNPKDGKRYYLKNGDEAYRIMRILGLGISNKDLVGIPE